MLRFSVLQVEEAVKKGSKSWAQLLQQMTI